ncbi:hypothetical protein EB796_011556 [Bugula neritina]|uniref:Peptidase A2 domain-containing protein n=1 Tax=Bugula neritina TaxID=10212 RepID=A0A7J7JW04_BUGNE|nr:hypothetical protein EB796_011556 [Bugula neritina]
MLIIGSQEFLLRLFMINILRTNVSNVGKAITKIRDVQLMELDVQNAINSTTGPECSKLQQTQRIKFKLDTGASLSVCGPLHVSRELISTNTILYGPGQTLLTCLGTIKCQITSKNERINGDLYVIQDQTTPLLSRSACEKLNLISVDPSQCQIENVCVDEKLF